MNRVVKTVSMMGLVLRKTFYKELLLVLMAFAMYWIITPVAVTITAIILAAVILVLPFERKGRRAMLIIKRFAFDEEDLEVIFGVIAFLEMNFVLLFLRIAYVIKVGIECGFTNYGISPLNIMKLREDIILFGNFPKIDLYRVFFGCIILLVLSIIVTKVVNRNEK